MGFLGLVLFIASLISAASQENDCSPIYVRWPRVRLNLTSRVTGPYTLEECAAACSKDEHPGRPGYPLQCSGFDHKHGASNLANDCQLFQKDQVSNLEGNVEYDDRYSFYWKYCVKVKEQCKSAYQFDFHIDRYMDYNESKRRILTFQVEDCLDQCLGEKSFECRSVSFNRTAGYCYLSGESRLSKPSSVRVNSNPNYRIDYYENKCHNDCFTFHHECQQNGILVSVDAKFPYTGAMYGLYDFFSCRVEPKEETKFRYFFPFPEVSKNCSDSMSLRDGEYVLEVVLSTDNVIPLYFLTDEDLIYKAVCSADGKTHYSASTIGAQVELVPPFSKAEAVSRVALDPASSISFASASALTSPSAPASSSIARASTAETTTTEESIWADETETQASITETTTTEESISADPAEASSNDSSTTNGAAISIATGKSTAFIPGKKPVDALPSLDSNPLIAAKPEERKGNRITLLVRYPQNANETLPTELNETETSGPETTTPKPVSTSVESLTSSASSSSLSASQTSDISSSSSTISTSTTTAEEGSKDEEGTDPGSASTVSSTHRATSTSSASTSTPLSSSTMTAGYSSSSSKSSSRVSSASTAVGTFSTTSTSSATTLPTTSTSGSTATASSGSSSSSSSSTSASSSRATSTSSSTSTSTSAESSTVSSTTTVALSTESSTSSTAAPISQSSTESLSPSTSTSTTEDEEELNIVPEHYTVTTSPSQKTSTTPGWLYAWRFQLISSTSTYRPPHSSTDYSSPFQPDASSSFSTARTAAPDPALSIDVYESKEKGPKDIESRITSSATTAFSTLTSISSSPSSSPSSTTTSAWTSASAGRSTADTARVTSSSSSASITSLGRFWPFVLRTTQSSVGRWFGESTSTSSSTTSKPTASNFSIDGNTTSNSVSATPASTQSSNATDGLNQTASTASSVFTTPTQPSTTTTSGPPKKILFDVFHNGQPVSAVVVGSRITLSFLPSLSLPGNYMTLVGCQVEPVNSPYAWERDPLQIVKNGCQADGVGLVCPPLYTEAGVKVEMEAFRYTTTGEVLYSCLIRICPYGPCPQPACTAVDGCNGQRRAPSLAISPAFPNNPAISFGRRRKRQPATLPVLSFLPINADLQQNLVTLAGDHVVTKKLVVVNSETELQYYLRTGNVPSGATGNIANSFLGR